MATVVVKVFPGIRLTVHDLGGSGAPVLAAHATGFHGQVWAPVAARLGGYHLWAPDLRAHGGSPVPEGTDLTWAAVTDDLLAVVDALGLEGTLGVGHSMGAAALLRAESVRPGTFRALYAYEPIVFPNSGADGDDVLDGGGTDGGGGTGARAMDDAGEGDERPDDPLTDRLVTGARRRRATFGSFDDALDHFSARQPIAGFDPDARAAYVRHGFAPQPDGTVVLRCRPDDEAELYVEGARHDTSARLAAVTCPVTVAYGAVDDAPTAAMAVAVAAALPHARLVRHDDLGHFGPLTHPEVVAADIRTAFG